MRGLVAPVAPPAFPPCAASRRYRETDFTPFDPVTKRTEAIVVGPQGEMVVTKGATKVVLELCADKERVREAVMSANDGLASRGFRSLGVAVKYNSKQAGGGAGLGSALLGSGGDGWQFMGVLSLFDPPREDTAETLSAARSKGISVKMVTGDQTAIAIETSRSIKARRRFSLIGHRHTGRRRRCAAAARGLWGAALRATREKGGVVVSEDGAKKRLGDLCATRHPPPPPRSPSQRRGGRSIEHTIPTAPFCASRSAADRVHISHLSRTHSSRATT